MPAKVHYQPTNGVAVITVDNPPVNALSLPVREQLWEALERLEADNGVRAAVLACAGRTFIAGADISEFGRPMRDPWLPDLVQKFEDASKPIVAAIHGTALGGGLETAMGCHYRCAVPEARVGLPEVKLGVLPGAGGTQRLPRLAGIAKALDMMLSGEPLPAAAAREAGIIDEIVTGDLLAAAVVAAERLAAAGEPLRRVSRLPLDRTQVSADFFAELRRTVAGSQRGFHAPERIIQCVEAALELSFPEALQRERQLFFECEGTVQSRAQRHLFFAERAVKKIPGTPETVAGRALETAAVVGAGTMGRGIAAALAGAGLPVVMLEADAGALDAALEAIEAGCRARVEKGRMTAVQGEQLLVRISGARSYDDLAGADIVIEAVFETMDVKRKVFATLDAVCKPGAILASNTSTLDLDRIAAATGRPEDVVGLHFFAPADVMPLLEIVRGARTAPDVLATAAALARRIGKVGVVVGVCFGFVGNRMFFPYVREAQFMVLEGTAPERIDRALYEWGMAMGPLAVSDLSGLDVFHRVFEAWEQRPDDPAFFRMGTILHDMGRLGRKSGAGFYRYQGRTPVPDPAVMDLAAAEAKRLGIPRRDISDDEIVSRTLLAIINEGARVLEEGVVTRSGDIDVIFANGYGFPRYRGGPMFYADTLGLERVCADIRRFRDQYGDRYWTPASLLEALADEKRTFSEWSPA